MKNPSSWIKSDLYSHLDHAIALELWTIPLYLTALYSIKGLKDLDSKSQPEAANLIESVAIQEMLHLEIVCNICNALGHAPKFAPPNYDEKKGIPFIHPTKHVLPAEFIGYEVKPGALDENTLKLFCAIELPHPKKELIWDTEVSYQSISEMYEALKLGISHLWDQCYVGNKKNTKQKISFKEYQERSGRHHGFSQLVNSSASAVRAIDCIIEQGEGADSIHVPADFRPPHLEDGKEFEAGWFKGELSHYQKFRILHHHHKKIPPVHQHEPTVESERAQEQLESSFHGFLRMLEDGFNSEGPDMPSSFWHNMFALKKSIIEVWESGACPRF